MRRIIVGLVFGAAVGCAGPGVQTVSQARWQKVPAAERTQIDQSHAEDLAAAQAEVATAEKELDAARTPQPAKAHPSDPAFAGAFAKVESARAAWQRANVAWREQRLAAARAHVDVIVCDRELARAEAIDYRAGDDDGMDTTPYHAQLGKARDAWFRAQDRAAQARKGLDAAGESLAAAKEQYATLVRDVAPVASADGGGTPYVPMPW
jgi:hypothetical protein